MFKIIGRIIGTIFIIIFLFLFIETRKRVIRDNPPENFKIIKNITVEYNKDLPKKDICQIVEDCIKQSDDLLKKLKITYSEDFDSYHLHENADRRIYGSIKLIEKQEIDYSMFQLRKEKIQLIKDILNIYTKLIPEEWRNEIIELEIFSNDTTIAYISDSEQNYSKKKLGINIDIEKIDKIELIYVLLHEFAHIFSLDINQMQTIPCDNLNCFSSTSYLVNFSALFYDVVPRDWRDNNNKDIEKLFLFYDLNRDNYVTFYSTLNIYEDFAESFVYFVLNPLNDYSGGKYEKIRFFYQYPELVELKTRLVKNIYEIIENETISK